MDKEFATNNAHVSFFEYVISVETFFSPWQRDGFQTGIYSNTVVLQHHSVVMTKADKIYKVKCTYDMSSKNITFGMMPIRDPEMISITSAPEAPPPRIRILDSRSREVETVRIGDKLTFRIEIPEDSKFASSIFVLRRSSSTVVWQKLTLINCISVCSPVRHLRSQLRGYGERFKKHVPNYRRRRVSRSYSVRDTFDSRSGMKSPNKYAKLSGVPSIPPSSPASLPMVTLCSLYTRLLDSPNPTAWSSSVT